MDDSIRLGCMLDAFQEMPRVDLGEFHISFTVHAGDFIQEMRRRGHPNIRHLLSKLVEVGALEYTQLPNGDDGYQLMSVKKWRALAATDTITP